MASPFFREAAAGLTAVLGDDWLAEHVGSTSVPGLVAKPVIDLAVRVPAGLHARDVDGALATAGWVEAPTAVSTHEVRMRMSGWVRTHIAHFFSTAEWDTAHQRLFADWLRRHPEDAQRYAELKTTAWAEGERGGPTRPRSRSSCRRWWTRRAPAGGCRRLMSRTSDDVADDRGRGWRPVPTMQSVTSPIRPVIGQVFIPVRDMPAAVEWYAALLGFEPGQASHHGTIYDIPVDGETRLALDSNRPDFDASGPPRFFWWTQDMAGTVRHLRDLGITITSDVEDIGSVSYVQFEDPDGNPLMVCQPS